MLVWIQKHEYSYIELEAGSSLEGVEKFLDFDWAQEIIDVKESEGEDCPPGFGVVREDGKILHIIPNQEGNCLVHFHYRERKRFLLLFAGTVRSTITRKDVSLDDCVSYIERIYAGDLDQNNFNL